MYDVKKKCWVASPAPAETPEDSLASDFALADAALEKASAGTQNVEAVYLMETSAKAGYAPACLAMAEMFKYGWAVGKSKKLWYYWIEQAAAAGDEGAKAIVEKHKKAKRRRLITIAAAAGAVLIAVAGVVWFIATMPKVGNTRISLPSGVELGEMEEFDEKIDRAQKLRENYDTDDMKSGKVPTNRILLIYTGKSLNLRKYKVVEAITDGEMITLQFDDAAEAERCFNDLKALPQTEYISMDEYHNLGEAINTLPVKTDRFGLQTYHSDVSGYDYYSWGVQAMEMDRYAAYLAKKLPDKECVVAVIDTGTEPNKESQDRILDGVDIVYGGNGHNDQIGHGTHVAGTVLDATRGLNVKVLPVQVFEQDSASDMDVCYGIDYAISQKVQVINMSLGGYCNDTGNVKHHYLQKAIEAGVIVVVAAGNESDDTGHFCPAHFGGCITVAACSENGQPTDFSNYGKAVDVIAPGDDICSYVPAPEYLDVYDGTSMASPHVAALAAMIWLEYESTPANTERFIKAYCSGGYDSSRYGEGIPLAAFFDED